MFAQLILESAKSLQTQYRSIQEILSAYQALDQSISMQPLLPFVVRKLVKITVKRPNNVKNANQQQDVLQNQKQIH